MLHDATHTSWKISGLLYAPLRPLHGLQLASSLIFLFVRSLEALRWTVFAAVEVSCTLCPVRSLPTGHILGTEASSRCDAQGENQLSPTAAGREAVSNGERYGFLDFTKGALQGRHQGWILARGTEADSGTRTGSCRSALINFQIGMFLSRLVSSFNCQTQVGWRDAVSDRERCNGRCLRHRTRGELRR